MIAADRDGSAPLVRPPRHPSPVPESAVTETARIPIIGITGSIGAGKSTVSQILRELECVVADADADARDVLSDPDVPGTLAGWWGDGVIDEHGQVDRVAVAEIVFGDPEQRRRLEALVHPRVRARRDEAFAAAPSGTPALVMDVPLLFESGLDADCDVVVFVDAPTEVRRERTVRNRGWDSEELDRREASQSPLDAKRSRADHVLVNAGGIDELRLHVVRLLDQINHDHD